MIDYVTEFLGIKTHYHYDCENYDRYRKYHLSRKIPCEEHDNLRKLKNKPYPYIPMFPIADEEYYENIDSINFLF